MNQLSTTVDSVTASLPISRAEFVSNIPKGWSTLEIGPFAFPTLSGPKVQYFDVLDADQIRAECIRLNLSSERVPYRIDFVDRDISLGQIDENFDVVYSSHVIEHTPDLFAHMASVHRMLKNKGEYFLVIPDKRFCFDHYKTLSTVGDAIAAFEERQIDCSLKIWVERYTHGTHNDVLRHWAGDHGPTPRPGDLTKISTALREFRSPENAAKMSPHLWFFTPDTFAEIMHTGYGLGLCKLRLKEVYKTANGAAEFYAVMERDQ